LDIKNIFSVIAGFVFVLGFIPYIIAIFKGETKPQKASWLIWASVDTLILVGMIAKNTINGQIVGAVLCAWFVFSLAFKKGKPGWSCLDKTCLGGGLFGVILWIIYGNATPGILIGSIVLVVAAFPTFTSSWKNPSYENKLAWVIFWLSCVFTFLGISEWTLQALAQPSSFLLVESIMMYILFFHKKKKE